MAFNVRPPLWFSTIAPGRPGAYAFAGLYFFEAAGRASLVTVVSLQSYEILQNSQHVSMLYTVTGIAALVLSFLIPYIIRLIARRYTYSLGVLFIASVPFWMLGDDIITQSIAIISENFAAACLNITLSLYIMDYIQKQELVRSEPIRFTISVIPWTVCPFLGVYLWQSHGMIAVAMLTGGLMILMLCLFWYLRLQEKIIKAGARPIKNPGVNLYRFFSQPRLRLAWWLAFIRSVWWTTIFIYTPIVIQTNGGDKYFATLVISLANMTLICNIFTGKLAHKFSVRKVLAAAFLFSGILLSLIIFVEGQLYMMAGIFIVGSLFITWSDGLGTIPFMRAVHPYEREDMTTVYRTYLDASRLLGPLFYGLLLLLLPLNAIFTILGGVMIFTGYILYKYLPKKL